MHLSVGFRHHRVVVADALLLSTKITELLYVGKAEDTIRMLANYKCNITYSLL